MTKFSETRYIGVVIALFGLLFITSCAALNDESVDFAQLSQFGVFPCDDNLKNSDAQAAWSLNFQDRLSDVAEYQLFEVTSYGRCKFRVLGSSERGPTQFDPVDPRPQGGSGPNWNVFAETLPVTFGAFAQRLVDPAKEACAGVLDANDDGTRIFSKRGLCIRNHLNRSLRGAEFSTILQGRSSPLREVIILSYRGRVVGLFVQEDLVAGERTNVIFEYAFDGMNDY